MVRIIADTTCGVPIAELNAKGIAVIPQVITIGNECFYDDYQLTVSQFLNFLEQSQDLPKTAAPPPSLYSPHFESARAAGDSVLVITPSADLSGTYRSASVAAAEFTDVDIHILDTRLVAGGLGSLVLLAKQWADEGIDLETIEKRVASKARLCHTFFLVPTLDYLHRGGRIGGASHLLGSLLQIKPILCIQEGKVDPYEKVRTYKQALETLEEITSQYVVNNAEACLSISHGGAENDALRLAAALKQHCQVSEIPIYAVPPAIIVHGGPGVLATSVFAKPGK